MRTLRHRKNMFSKFQNMKYGDSKTQAKYILKKRGGQGSLQMHDQMACAADLPNHDSCCSSGGWFLETTISHAGVSLDSSAAHWRCILVLFSRILFWIGIQGKHKSNNYRHHQRQVQGHDNGILRFFYCHNRYVFRSKCVLRYISHIIYLAVKECMTTMHQKTTRIRSLFNVL